MGYRRIALDHVCGGLVPGRVFRVCSVTLQPLEPPDWDWRGEGENAGAVEVEYTITPPLPPHGKGDSVASWPVVWTWGASDDAGTEYLECGGAYGAAPGGERTTGTLSLRPLPPAGARVLRVVLRPWFPWADATEMFRECAVEVDLTALSEVG